MIDQNDDDGTASATRIVEATLYRKSELMGPIDILGYTKHGPTAVISVEPSEGLLAGDVLKTKNWILSVRQLIIVGEHQKPMKLPGVWYEVQTVAPPKK